MNALASRAMTPRAGRAAVACTMPCLPMAGAGGAIVASQAGLDAVRMPFDLARTQYALGVQAGLIKRSILASRDLEQVLGAMEQWTLGPLARRV